ncbi:unnamed protein product [Nesidiocoris tenuis]|uniref:Uncharacterized protein n=1 Tax=Nesidiocoris tenuis TaxID=355587 RepID=A0A6H5HJH4_9HEMI|nr:unnamed protein product [Nesidiocoris tenuis]
MSVTAAYREKTSNNFLTVREGDDQCPQFTLRRSNASEISAGHKNHDLHSWSQDLHTPCPLHVQIVSRFLIISNII